MTGSGNREHRSAHRLRRERDRRVLCLAIASLVAVGGGLITLILGMEGLLTAMPFLFAGAALVAVPWVLLLVLQRWRDRTEQSERAALDQSGSLRGTTRETDNPGS